MKLMINIPDEAYELLKSKSELDNIAESIIANGTPISTEGDLISRKYVESIVKAEFVDLQDGTEEWRTYVNDTCENILNKVDNAPTVEYTFEEAFQKTVCDNKLYCPSRQKGKWKETGYETGALGITYRQTQCSNCGWEHSLPMWLNFCPNCGAKMQKGSSE